MYLSTIKVYLAKIKFGELIYKNSTFNLFENNNTFCDFAPY